MYSPAPVFRGSFACIIPYIVYPPLKNLYVVHLTIDRHYILCYIIVVIDLCALFPNLEIRLYSAGRGFLSHVAHGVKIVRHVSELALPFSGIAPTGIFI